MYKGAYIKADFPISASCYLIDEYKANYFDFKKMENSLKDSGWYLRKKQWQKTINYKTKVLELSLVVRKKSNRVNIAYYLKEKLAEQGILLNVIQVSDSDYANYINNKKYDLILCEITNPISPDLTSYFGNGNLANFNNDEAKRILNEINNISDKEELKNRFKKLYEIYDNEIPYIGIGRNKIYAINSSYLNGESFDNTIGSLNMGEDTSSIVYIPENVFFSYLLTLSTKFLLAFFHIKLFFIFISFLVIYINL